MKAISQRAKKVMDLLTANWDSVGNGRKIDNTEGFMPVHVEFIRECSLGQIFSIAHYYKKNGDMMRDPDIEFIKGGDGEYYPISFWQDFPLKRDDAVEWGGDGEITRIDPKMQAALASFANTWMKNIKVQQGL